MKVHLNGCEPLRPEIERIIGLGKVRSMLSIELTGQRLIAGGPELEDYTNVEGEVFNFLLDPEYDIIFLQPQQDLSLLLALHAEQFRDIIEEGVFQILVSEEEPTQVEVLA